MRAAVRVGVMGGSILFIFCLILFHEQADAAGGARTLAGRGGKFLALSYHVNQANPDPYINALHVPEPGKLSRLMFDVIKTGGGGGSMVVGVARVLGDGGIGTPLCQITVACDAPAGREVGHHHADEGYECSADVVDEEVLSVEVLSSTCGTKPDGNITIFFEF